MRLAGKVVTLRSTEKTQSFTENHSVVLRVFSVYLCEILKKSWQIAAFMK
jgi:hypothetical protein